MLVFDSSGFINAWWIHYPPATFPSVWQLISDAMADGRIVAPRAVYQELRIQDDAVLAWAKVRKDQFAPPSQRVQLLAGLIRARLPNPGVRDVADPFVIAEAETRGFTVVTYEGTNTLTGARSRRWADRMPGICADRRSSRSAWPVPPERCSTGRCEISRTVSYRA
jgi:hypothetical protein